MSQLLKIVHNRLKVKTLKNKLLISYTLIIISAITAVGYISYNNASNVINEELRKNKAQITVQISNGIDALVSDINRMSLVVNSDEELLAILKNTETLESLELISEHKMMQQSIQNITGFIPNIEGFSIFAVDGRTFSMGSRSVRLGYNYAESSWYNQLKNHNSLFIGTHFQDHVNEAYTSEVISLVKTIKDQDTLKILGYVLIDMNTRSLEEVFGAKNDFDQSSNYIIDEKNNLIYSSKYEVCSFDQIESITSEFVNTNDVRFVISEVNGIEILFSYYTSDFTDWMVINANPLNVVNKKIDSIANFSIIVIVASLIVTVLLSFIIAIDITKPLTKLSEKMTLIEGGDFKVTAGIDSSDEIGQLGVSFDRMALKLDEMITKVYSAELAKKEAEINALQAQINPHFLYNTLATIDSIATINGDAEASAMCQALGKMFRYNVKNGDDSTIGYEVENIKMYLLIEKIRFADRFDYNIELDETLMNCKLKKLLIQPIIENSIVHGLEMKKGNVWIDIKIVRVKNNLIEIRVEDSGKGMSADRLKQVNDDIGKSSSLYWQEQNRGRYHVGLKNVNYRIKLNYGDAFGLTIESEKGVGTTVILKLPEIMEEKIDALQDDDR